MLQSVRAFLLAEEPRVERLKAQLKELYSFPHDPRQLADEVLAAGKEYQRWAESDAGHGLPPKHTRANINQIFCFSELNWWVGFRFWIDSLI